MAGKSKNLNIFSSNSIGSETYFGPDLEYTGNSLRLNSDLINTDYGKINAKAILNTNIKNEISPQLRITASSPDLKLGEIGDVKLKANLENWTTLKFNKNFEKQDLSNSARIKLKASEGDYTAYSAIKFDCSQNNPGLKFNGLTVGVQKNFGKKVSAYVDSYLPNTCLKGNLNKTSYALGLVMKF